MNSRKRNYVTAVTLSLLVFPGFCASAGDTYYRWNDASGTPVNSDRPPPPGVEYDVITTNTNRMIEEPIAEAEIPETASAKPASSARQQSASTQAMASDKDPQACAAARKNRETLRTHARIRIPDGNGNFRFLNPAEKTQQLEHSEAAIAHYCE